MILESHRLEKLFFFFFFFVNFFSRENPPKGSSDWYTHKGILKKKKEVEQNIFIKESTLPRFRFKTINKYDSNENNVKIIASTLAETVINLKVKIPEGKKKCEFTFSPPFLLPSCLLSLGRFRKVTEIASKIRVKIRLKATKKIRLNQKNKVFGDNCVTQTQALDCSFKNALTSVWRWKFRAFFFFFEDTSSSNPKVYRKFKSDSCCGFALTLFWVFIYFYFILKRNHQKIMSENNFLFFFCFLNFNGDQCQAR